LEAAETGYHDAHRSRGRSAGAVGPAGGYLDNARQRFLLTCYTGLRFSDLVSIKAEHLRGQVLRMTTQKTRETITVPLRIAALVHC
jgi:integrase